jgi:hypothetical protein
MNVKYQRVYRALRTYGFTDYKAIEILIDAKRKDQPALLAVRVAARPPRMVH